MGGRLPPGPVARRAGVVGAVLAHLVVGALYASVVPPWEVPDEPWHLAYAEALAAGHLPEPHETYEAHQPPLYYAWPALGLRALGWSSVPRSPDNVRYPFARAAYVHPPEDPGEGQLRLLRTLSGQLGALVVALAWATARATGRGRQSPPGDRSQSRHNAGAPMLVTWLVALWPQLLFIGHGLSNDVLAAASGGLVTYGAVRWAATPDRGRAAPRLALVGLVLGGLTKLNVLALAPAVVVAWLLAARARRTDPTTMLRGASAALALLAAAAGGVWLALPTTASRVAGDLRTRALDVRPELAEAGAVASGTRGVLVSLFGRFGWLNVDLPVSVLAGAGLAGAVALAGLPAAWRGAAPGERRALAVAGTAVVSLLAATVKNLLTDPQAQGRFLFPALGALALLLAVGWLAGVPRRARRFAAAAVVAALTAVNAHVLLSVLPAAYATSRVAPPVVDTRVLPPTWTVAARLAGPDGTASQTFRVYRPGLRRVEVPVAWASGVGELSLQVETDDGHVVGRASAALNDLHPNDWLGVDLGPLRGSAGRDYVLRIGVVGPGAVGLWGAPAGLDVYPEGRLMVDGSPGTDLVLLTLLEPARP